MELFNAKTQQVETPAWEVDANNEIVATFQDGSVVKFPAGLTKENFVELITQHQEANAGQEVITEAVLQKQAQDRANSLSLIGDTTPESQSNGDDQTTTPE